MKAHLVFKLPEEKIAYEVAMNAHNYAVLVHKWTQLLKEHGDALDTQTNWLAVEIDWNNLLKEAGIDPYES